MQNPHIKELGVALNNPLRTVAGSLQATPVNYLLILSGIALAALHREAAVMALAHKAELDADHFLHKTVCESPQCARYCSVTSSLDMPTNSCTIRHRIYLSRPGSGIDGMKNSKESQTTLSSTSFSSCQMISPAPNFRAGSGQLNSLRSVVGRFASSIKEWELKDSPSVHHIIENCPLYQPPNGEQGLAILDDTRSWVASTKLEI